MLRDVWIPSAVDKPPPITPQGLSLERQTYLYEKIREYCHEETRDMVCPAPAPPSEATDVPVKRRRT